MCVTFSHVLATYGNYIMSQWRYLFARCSYVFYDVRITLFFGTFELRMEITLQLRFVFVHR